MSRIKPTAKNGVVRAELTAKTMSHLGTRLGLNSGAMLFLCCFFSVSRDGAVVGGWGGLWSQRGNPVGAGAVGPAGQGVAVALSAGGDTAILGGRLDQGGVGAAWVFVATASAPAPGNK
jgi:hypothetical protein